MKRFNVQLRRGGRWVNYKPGWARRYDFLWLQARAIERDRVRALGRKQVRLRLASADSRTGRVLHGQVWEPGLSEVDGNWVAQPIADVLLRERGAGRWHGSVWSGYRSVAYQRILFDAAVSRYGSYTAAARMVAPPGKSRHNRKGADGAVDCTNLSELVRGGRGPFYQPMNYEPWHGQLRGH